MILIILMIDSYDYSYHSFCKYKFWNVSLILYMQLGLKKGLTVQHFHFLTLRAYNFPSGFFSDICTQHQHHYKLVCENFMEVLITF